MHFSLIIFSLPIIFARPNQSPQINSNNNEFNLLFIGDWGGINGHFKHSGYAWGVARSMNNYASLHPVESIFLMGDNFYDYGVQNVTDPRFEDTFQKTFSVDDLPYLANIRMPITSGNHDYHQNVTQREIIAENRI